MAIVTCKNLSVNFGSVAALKSVSLEMQSGELFGLIGPDGAGKTTLMRIIASLLIPDQGTVRFDGHDPVKDYAYVRQHIGYSPGRFSLYQDLSILENLEFFSGVFGHTLEESYELIAPVYKMLEPFKHRKAGALSGGMKQKLSLCCALVHRPKLLLLDEPTTGVDAVSRDEFWTMLEALKASGMSTLVATPYMDEASRCDRVALMSKGDLLRTDRPEAIAAAYPLPLYEVKTRKVPTLLSYLRTRSETHVAFPFGDSIHWTTKSELEIAAIYPVLQLYDAELELKAIPATIEDSFMAEMLAQEQ